MAKGDGSIESAMSLSRAKKLRKLLAEQAKDMLSHHVSKDRREHNLGWVRFDDYLWANGYFYDAKYHGWVKDDVAY